MLASPQIRRTGDEAKVYVHVVVCSCSLLPALNNLIGPLSPTHNIIVCGSDDRLVHVCYYVALQLKAATNPPCHITNAELDLIDVCGSVSISST